MSDYQRPAQKRGLICHYVAWDSAGQIREARYRKPDRAEPPPPDRPARAPPIARGIVEASTPFQGNLL